MSDLINLLPPASTAIERAAARAPDLARLNTGIIKTLWHPATCPAALLPWLAWALSVDEWDETAPLDIQRNIIANAIPIHKLKGTAFAVKTALAVLGHTGHITEWWQTQPPGDPHTFIADIEIDARGIDLTQQNHIERQIIAVKPARSHFSMRLIGRANSRPRIAHALLSGESATIYPFVTTRTDAPPPRASIAIGMQTWGATSVYPQQQ
jgi:phage tail P2-like protein